MAPGTVALAFFGDRALAALRDPGWGSAAIAGALLLVLLGLGKLVERRMAPHASGPVSPSSR
jgi:hypothetical protein